MRFARFSSSFSFLARIFSWRCFVLPPPPALLVVSFRDVRDLRTGEESRDLR
jgi:hypothetical protein